MKTIAAGAVAALGLALVPGTAQADIVAEGNVARADGDWGVELGGGFDVLSIGGFKLRPMGGVFVYSDDDERYYEDRNSLGPTQCRDRETGFFVDDERCDDGALRAYAKVEATFTLLGTAEAGLGARYSVGNLRPYATASLPIVPLVRLKANVGDGYYALGVKGSF